MGDDPIDNNGNIPAVVYANNHELIIVKITPEAAVIFNSNKYESLNYYGVFKKASDYDSYILVDKITAIFPQWRFLYP